MDTFFSRRTKLEAAATTNDKLLDMTRDFEEASTQLRELELALLLERTEIRVTKQENAGAMRLRSFFMPFGC